MIWMNLIVYGPNKNQKIDYKWNKMTTTLGTLLKDVIKAFHLESDNQEVIRLVTISDAQIELRKHSHVKLSVVGLKNNSSVWIKILHSRYDNACVCIQSTHSNQTLALYVPPTNTIAELNKKIERCLCIVHELYFQTNEKLDLHDYFQTLEQLGVQAGQIIYARPRLSIYPDTANSSSHQIQTKDKVIIKCQLSPTEMAHITASVEDTVTELRRRIAPYQKDSTLTPFKFRYGKIILDDTQSSRCLTEFGIKPGCTIDAQVEEFTRSRDSDTTKPIGFINERNSCFMNGALQCLVHVIPLTQYFLDAIDRNPSNIDYLRHSYGEVTAAYVELLYELQRTGRSNNALLPNRLRTAMSVLAPSFATEDQQDAQEFLNLLLNTIHKQLMSNNPSHRPTVIRKLFFGKIESMITCLQCNHVKKKVEKLRFLSLPLGRQQREFHVEFHSKKGQQSQTNVLVFASGRIEHLVQAFVGEKLNLFDRIIVQTIETDESLDLTSPLYMLTDFHVKMIELKEHSHCTPPIQLEINPKKITLYECLQEFISIEYLQDAWLCREQKCQQETKATKQIQFCTLPPVLIIQLKRFASVNGVQKKVKTFVQYPIDGLDLRNPSTSPDAIYDLIAVSNHSGSIRTGHYTTFARQNASTDRWYKFDDAVVSIVPPTSEIVTADAYLLFYIKRNYQIRQ